jgi:hypothetical protein
MPFAPSTNLVPVTVIEKLPTGTAVGEKNDFGERPLYRPQRFVDPGRHSPRDQRPERSRQLLESAGLCDAPQRPAVAHRSPPHSNPGGKFHHLGQWQQLPERGAALATGTPLVTQFPQNSYFASQLQQVAQILQVHAALGPRASDLLRFDGRLRHAHRPTPPAGFPVQRPERFPQRVLPGDGRDGRGIERDHLHAGFADWRAGGRRSFRPLGEGHVCRDRTGPEVTSFATCAGEAMLPLIHPSRSAI